MSVLPSGYLNSLCEIKDYDGNILLRGYLNRITDDDEFQIVRGGSKPLPTVMENKTLDVEVLNNIYGNALFVGKVAASTKNHLKLSEVQAKKDFEKRKYFRVDTVFPANAYMGEGALEAVKNLVYNANATAKLKHLSIDIDNLSISGIHIVIKGEQIPLEVGTQLVVVMILENKELTLPITVRRATTNRQGEPNGFGCSFDLTEGWEIDTIGNYLFACQRKQIQKQRYGKTEDNGKEEAPEENTEEA